MKKNMKEIKVGVCEGRHPLPVDHYVFPTEINPLKVEKLEATSSNRLMEIAIKEDVKRINTTTNLYNQVDYHDITVAVYDARLVVYATGLTVALLAVLKAAKHLFIDVVVMHYDRDSGNYYPQEV